jgi:hypothetical protein
MSNEPRNGIQDIFMGETVEAWSDKRTVYLSFPYCTVQIPQKLWESVKNELKEALK